MAQFNTTVGRPATLSSLRVSGDSPLRSPLIPSVGGVRDFSVGVEIPIGGGIPIDIDFGGGGPAQPAQPSGGTFAPTTPGCPPLFTPDPITGECRFDIDPGPGQGLPGGNGAAGTGLNRPRAVSRTVLECPTFADGKKGILWMNALTGDVVCLPRRTSGKGFGLIRKNKPRARAFISAATAKGFTDRDRAQKKVKSLAMKAGFSCKKR